jgi:hypothetical protein
MFGINLDDELKLDNLLDYSLFEDVCTVSNWPGDSQFEENIIYKRKSFKQKLVKRAGRMPKSLIVFGAMKNIFGLTKKAYLIYVKLCYIFQV